MPCAALAARHYAGRPDSSGGPVPGTRQTVTTRGNERYSYTVDEMSRGAAMTVPWADTDTVSVVQHNSWDELVRRLEPDTAYHSLGYHEASATLEVMGTVPVLLYHQGDRADTAMPLLLRPMPDNQGWDATSAYGFGGPVSASGVADPGFGEAVDEWALANNLVASFVRYQPLIGNHHLGPRTTVSLAGHTIAWNLRQEDLLARMHPHHRRAVRKADRAGIAVRTALAPADLQVFRAMYEGTMRRQGAQPFYFFPDAYWEVLLGRCSANLLMLEAVLDDKVVAAILCLVGPQYLHYHLGASEDEGRLVGASNRLLLAAAQWGQDRGLAALHLGGGLRGTSESSLFVFKQRFDPTTAPLDFHVGRWVHDPMRYQALSSAAPDVHFFPPWRA